LRHIRTNAFDASQKSGKSLVHHVSQQKVRGHLAYSAGCARAKANLERVIAVFVMLGIV